MTDKFSKKCTLCRKEFNVANLTTVHDKVVNYINRYFCDGCLEKVDAFIDICEMCGDVKSKRNREEYCEEIACRKRVDEAKQFWEDWQETCDYYNRTTKF